MMEPQGSDHPSSEDLALLVGGEMPYVHRWQVQDHVHHCAKCEHELEQFQAAHAELRRLAEAEMLTGYEAIGEWVRLEREMAGNISVGVAAARAIGNVGRHRLHSWRVAALAGGLALVFAAGWLLNVPGDDTSRILGAFRTAWSGPQVAAGIILQTTPHGVSVRSQGAMLTVLHPASANVTASFTSNSSVAMRYVDDETGQVTITNVYGE
jgi:hypothetical protein